jgi:hypothetical protein
LFNKMVEMKHIIIDDDVVMELLLGFVGFIWITYYLNWKWFQFNITHMNRQTSSPWKHAFKLFKEWSWFIFILFRELGKNQTWEVITMLNNNPTTQETRQISFKKGDFLMWLRGTLH